MAQSCPPTPLIVGSVGGVRAARGRGVVPADSCPSPHSWGCGAYAARKHVFHYRAALHHRLLHAHQTLPQFNTHANTRLLRPTLATATLPPTPTYNFLTFKTNSSPPSNTHTPTQLPHLTPTTPHLHPAPPRHTSGQGVPW
ncbi:hypothetical protein E2C01_062705 [Portunus trituberculatus]|uniref:Uncharacterized protein n=1 Tax=Portunus trituberculatus TaxID=210409 RepID=A0A5B7HEF0_PORTR|nr:hypothetical protein [Portunus trituberculatus]